MKFIEAKWRRLAIIFGIAISVSFFIIGLILGHYKLTSSVVPIDSGPKPGTSLITDNLIALGLFFGLLPVAVVYYLNYRYQQSVEANIPRFLRDILQRIDSGLILPLAILEASKVDYGPVSYQFGVAMTKFHLGYDFSTSIMEAGESLHHSYAPQAGQIISEAYLSGGKTHEVLSSAVNLFNDLDQTNQQRRAELRPYVQLAYISIAIYLVIALVVVNNFIDPYITTAQAQIHAAGNALFSFPKGPSFKIPLGGKSYFISTFYLSALMESVFSGVVAGKIVDRSALAGLRHSIILVAISVAAFMFLGSLLGYHLFP